MAKRKKMFWWWVLVIAVLVVLAVVFRGKLGWGKAAITMPPSYSAAVNQYANARIQFDMRCQAQPVNGVYKNGSYLMLDNRSGDARIIVVNGVQYKLAGYGWKIIQLSAKTAPVSWPIDCGAARNVSNINIQ
jgi:hypothetical protein